MLNSVDAMARALARVTGRHMGLCLQPIESNCLQQSGGIMGHYDRNACTNELSLRIQALH